MSNKKIRVLVCGATGFIGRNIAETLSIDHSYDVRGVYFRTKPYETDSLELIQADLTDKDDVQKALQGVDIVIQAAATTSGAKDIVQRPYLHVTDNAVMNSLIFRQAYEQGIKHVIFFSCSVMYQSSDKPVKEDDFDANKAIFPSYFGVGWTKVYIEKMCEFYSRIGDTKYTVIRHSNIYGPYDKYDLERSHVFGATITKVMTAKDGDSISIWGTGEEGRDLLYVSDLVDFVKKAMTMQTTPFELVNTGNGSVIAIKDLVAKIIQRSGKSLKINHDISKPSIKTSLCLDIAKAERVFKWSPMVPLEDGIKLTLQWYKDNERQFKW